MQFLRANTATRITVGPFIDGVDGVTPETGLTVTALKLTFIVDDAGVPTVSINANATAAAGDNDLVHITGDTAGFYDLEFTANNVNFAGARAKLSINHSTANTCLPVFHEYMILPTQVYDSLINANDQLQVHANEISANLITATAIADDAITAAKLAANAITSAEFADGTITSAKFAANAITAGVIADSAIDAATFAANSITAAAIADNAIDIATFAADCKTGSNLNAQVKGQDNIAFGALQLANLNASTPASVGVADSIGSLPDNIITANAIAGGALNSDKFANDAITVDIIANNALTAAKFASNAITAAKVDPDVANEIWAKTGAVTSVALDVLVERIYQCLHNRMLANETLGTITLRNFANSANVATGEVVSSSGTTTRAALAWA